MRKIFLAGLMATSLLPAAAQAQWIDRHERAELRDDRRDIRQERRDLERAYRYGDRRDIERERRDYWDAHREYREDYRDARRDWDGPRRGYGRPWYPGYGYTLPRPAYGHSWSYRGDRVLLIDRWGRVVRVVPRYWR